VELAARGNPLALVSLGADGQSEIPGQPPPLTEHLEASYLRRAEGLGHRVRDLLLLTAVDDTGDLAVLLQAARRRGASEKDLAAAEERWLLTVAAGKVEFTHPLVRSAVYQNATSAARRKAHLALAAALNTINPARAIWHRAAAAVPPAEDVATQLIGLGATAARQADTDLARAYTRAAELTADPSNRVSWLLDAAEASWECGRPARGAQLVATARRTAQSRDHLARIDHFRGLLEALTGSALHGCDILLAGAEPILDVAPTRAAAMVFDAMRVASVAGDMQRVAYAGQTASRLMSSESHPASASFAAGIAELLTGHGAGAVAELEKGLHAIRDSDDAEQLCMAATAAAFTGDFTRTHLLASQAVTRCRETGALGHLAWALEVLVVTQLEAAPRQAEASADEGLRAARETDQVASEAIHFATLATVAAMRGDRSTTEKLAEQVFELDRAHGLAFPAARATAALGLLELGLGRPGKAQVPCEALATTHGHRAIQLAAADVAMLAAVWSGQDEKAHEPMATVGSWRWVREANAEWAEATLDRWQALVAPDAEASKLYGRSLTHQTQSPRSFPQALTHLLYGEHLRRIRQRSAARPQLRMAIEIFDRLDAVPWAARARTQLRATGETVRRYEDSPARLMPQELQVAQLVATGASTMAVADLTGTWLLLIPAGDPCLPYGCCASAGSGLAS
jgi:tetratricopeptide (TPR) repeat protein